MTTGLLWAKGGLNPILAIVIGLATGATAGVLNGVLAARFKLHPIVMTLATSTIFLGCTYLITHGEPVIGLPSQLLWMGASSFGPIPVSVVIMLVVVAAMQILLTRTQFGLRVRQVGGNTEAARLTGVNVSAVILGVFVVSGLLAALGGAIEMGRVGNAIPTLGSTLLFPIITASILGGTLLSGGEGSMIGTLFGAAVLTIINNALVVLQVDPYSQDIVQGSLVVAALIVDQFRRKQLTLRDLIRPEAMTATDLPDTMGGGSIVTMRGISKKYANVVALSDVDLSLRSGEIVALVGDNGAGKSTLIKVLTGAVRPDEGEIQIDGQPTEMTKPSIARNLGISAIYQDLALFNNLDASESVFAGREYVRRILGVWHPFAARRWLKRRSHRQRLGIVTLSSSSLKQRACPVVNGR